MKNAFGIVILLSASLAIAAGCSSASGPSLNPAASNCGSYCDKKYECVDKNSNVQECTDTCAAKAKNDSVFEAKVKECAECVEANDACTEAQKCSGDCLKVLLD